MKELMDYLENNLGEYLNTNKEDEVRFNCSFCDDAHYHLYINIEKKVYHCFKCGNSGHLSQMNIPNSILSSSPVHRIPVPQLLPSLPMKDIMPLPDNSYMGNRATNYLYDRGIKNINGLFYGIKDKWLGRVVFPIKEGGNIVFLVGRSFLGSSPKYLNSGGKKDYIYQLDKVYSYPHVVIVEGCIDALSTNNSIALLGKEITNTQYVKLRQRVDVSKPVYIGLDPDARKEAIHLAKKLSVHYKNVYICLFPTGKDMNIIQGKWQDYPLEKYDDYVGIKLLLEEIK